MCMIVTVCGTGTDLAFTQTISQLVCLEDWQRRSDNRAPNIYFF